MRVDSLRRLACILIASVFPASIAAASTGQKANVDYNVGSGCVVLKTAVVRQSSGTTAEVISPNLSVNGAGSLTLMAMNSRITCPVIDRLEWEEKATTRRTRVSLTATDGFSSVRFSLLRSATRSITYNIPAPAVPQLQLVPVGVSIRVVAGIDQSGSFPTSVVLRDLQTNQPITGALVSAGRLDLRTRTLLIFAGPARIGTTVNGGLFSVTGAGLPYAAGSALTNALGIPIGGRRICLDPDSLLFLSSQGQLPLVFQGYAGFLDAQGQGSLMIAIPALSALSGLTFFTSFVTLDPTSPQRVRDIANCASLTIT